MSGNTGEDPSSDESFGESGAVEPFTHTISNWKVLGKFDDSEGAAVLGHNTATTGIGEGVQGIVDSADDGAAGVHGGQTGTPDGAVYGVLGRTTATAYPAAGVRGEATALETIGVAGYNLTDPGNEYSNTFSAGVFGNTDRSNSYGVFGVNTETTGTNTIGVLGRTSSKSGAGVFGNNTAGGPALEANGRLVADESMALDATNGPNAHVGRISNNETGDTSCVLALQVGTSGDPGLSNNFITFFNGSGDPYGAIEGDGSGGVAYDSSGSDYAEYLPLQNPDKDIEPGEVVGIVDGEITRQTSGAEQVLVISDRAIVKGNSPGQSAEDRTGYEICAFIGQVPVQVQGQVDGGDLIVPSGNDDGTGRAVAPADYRPEDGPIVGRAWEPTEEEGPSEVTVAVGLETGKALEPAIDSLGNDLVQKEERIEELAANTDTLREENRRLQEANEQLRSRIARLEAHVGLDRSNTPGVADD